MPGASKEKPHSDCIRRPHLPALAFNRQVEDQHQQGQNRSEPEPRRRVSRQEVPPEDRSD